MKQRLVLVVGAGVLAAACGSNSPVSPSPAPVIPQVAQCVSSNTATVTFQNREVSSTIDLILDGSKLTTLSPGATSSPATVVAGMEHTVRWEITNSNSLACNTSTPSFVQCSTMSMWCPG